MHNISSIILILSIISLPCVSSAAQKSKQIPSVASKASTFSAIISRPETIDLKTVAAHQTSDGGYITATSDGDGVIISKTNSSGKKNWERVFGFISSGANIHPFYIADIQQTSDGGFLFTGANKYRGWMMRLKADGATVWEKLFDDYYNSNSMLQNVDGTFLIAVRIENYILLTKFDATGSTIWKRQFSDAYSGVNRSLGIVRYDGGFLMAYNKATPKHSGIRIVKLDVEGNTLWSKDMGDRIEKGIMPMLRSLTTTSDGGFALYGHIESGRFITGGLMPFIARYDRDGKNQWDSIISTDIRDGDIVERAAGGFAICGTFWVTRYSSAIMFSTMDKDGKVAATRLFGVKDITTHECSSLEVTPDGGFILGGRYVLTKGNTIGRSGGWLLKLDADGNNLSEHQLDFKKLPNTVSRYDGSKNDTMLGKSYTTNCDRQGAFHGTSNRGPSPDFNRDGFKVIRPYRLASVTETALWEPGEMELSYQIDWVVETTGRAPERRNIFKGTLKRGPCLVEKPLICEGNDENQNILIKPGTYWITLPERRCDGKTGNMYQRKIFVMGLPLEEVP